MPKRTRAAAAGERGDYSHLADEKLISLMGAGDAGAFAALYDRHSRAVYSFSYRMAGEKRAAEDFAQYAFLKVWRSAGTYRAQRGSVKTWLLTVVHNRGIDLLRSSASRRRTREEAEAEAPRSQPSEAFSEAWGNHRRDRLREALRDTPHEQREAVMLVHFSGLTQTEVSERLPLGTVKGACGSGCGSWAFTPRSGRWRSGSRSVDGPRSLFTQPRRRVIPRSSPLGGSEKFGSLPRALLVVLGGVRCL